MNVIYGLLLFTFVLSSNCPVCMYILYFSSFIIVPILHLIRSMDNLFSCINTEWYLYFFRSMLHTLYEQRTVFILISCFVYYIYIFMQMRPLIAFYERLFYEIKNMKVDKQWKFIGLCAWSSMTKEKCFVYLIVLSYLLLIKTTNVRKERKKSTTI